MRFGYREACLDHDTGTRHPETADRLRAIRRGLSKRHGVEYREGRLADLEALEAVHDPGYVEAVREFCEAGGGTWDADTVGKRAFPPASSDAFPILYQMMGARLSKPISVAWFWIDACSGMTRCRP